DDTREPPLKPEGSRDEEGGEQERVMRVDRRAVRQPVEEGIPLEVDGQKGRARPHEHDPDRFVALKWLQVQAFRPEKMAKGPARTASTSARVMPTRRSGNR